MRWPLLTTKVECLFMLMLCRIGCILYQLCFLLSMWRLDLMLTTSPRFFMQTLMNQGGLFFKLIKKTYDILVLMGFLYSKVSRGYNIKLWRMGSPCIAWEFIVWQVKAHHSDPLCVVTLYCFFGWSFLNLNHVKTTKDFHNVFAYYGKK
jgi:hypothetical protein